MIRSSACPLRQADPAQFGRHGDRISYTTSRDIIRMELNMLLKFFDAIHGKRLGPYSHKILSEKAYEFICTLNYGTNYYNNFESKLLQQKTFYREMEKLHDKIKNYRDMGRDTKELVKKLDDEFSCHVLSPHGKPIETHISAIIAVFYVLTLLAIYYEIGNSNERRRITSLIDRDLQDLCKKYQSSHSFLDQTRAFGARIINRIEKVNFLRKVHGDNAVKLLLAEIREIRSESGEDIYSILCHYKADSSKLSEYYGFVRGIFFNYRRIKGLRMAHLPIHHWQTEI